jgi:protein disulfide-isomerase A6
MKLISVLLVALCAKAALGLYSGGDDVVELTEKDFNKKVLKSDGVWAVEFYAP